MAASRTKKTLDHNNIIKQQRKTLLKSANHRMIKGICECALNTLKGTITLTPGQKKKLIKHRHLLRRLCDKNCRSWKSKNV